MAQGKESDEAAAENLRLIALDAEDLAVLAAHLQDAILRVGIEVQGEIATLVDGGFQKFLETSAGVREPALASQLKDLHDFEEDLRAGLGLTSLYNQALGTTFDRHAYDGLRK